jgi:hypothetical protein
MKIYSYTADVSDYIIWVRDDNDLTIYGDSLREQAEGARSEREIYARVSGCSSRGIQVMVNALNQMEIES